MMGLLLIPSLTFSFLNYKIGIKISLEIVPIIVDLAKKSN